MQTSVSDAFNKTFLACDALTVTGRLEEVENLIREAASRGIPVLVENADLAEKTRQVLLRVFGTCCSLSVDDFK